MPNFFPRDTAEWRLEEPPAIRKLSLSLWEMAVLTGVALRLYRAIIVGNSAQAGWIFVASTLALGVVLLLGMATLHLGNFPVHRWLWRAPLFGLVAAVAELVTSFLLVQTGREPLGSGWATTRDWVRMAPWVLLTRVAVVSLFALLLAGVVQVVRVVLLRRQHRAIIHTAPLSADQPGTPPTAP